MSEDVIEAGRFGATERQILFKIQLPLQNQLFWPELIRYYWLYQW
jgi:ABC-type proline/glycine betaine transport system permease subunit